MTRVSADCVGDAIEWMGVTSLGWSDGSDGKGRVRGERVRVTC